MTHLVATLLGEIPDTDLVSKLVEVDHGDTVTTSRAWTYIGTDHHFREYVGKMVRTDCWVVFKTGVKLAGEAEL